MNPSMLSELNRAIVHAQNAKLAVTVGSDANGIKETVCNSADELTTILKEIKKKLIEMGVSW